MQARGHAFQTLYLTRGGRISPRMGPPGFPRAETDGTDPAIRTDDDAEAALNGLFAWLAPLHDLNGSDLRQLRAMLKREWEKREPRGHERFRWTKADGYDQF